MAFYSSVIRYRMFLVFFNLNEWPLIRVDRGASPQIPEVELVINRLDSFDRIGAES